MSQGERLKEETMEGWKERGGCVRLAGGRILKIPGLPDAGWRRMHTGRFLVIPMGRFHVRPQIRGQTGAWRPHILVGGTGGT